MVAADLNTSGSKDYVTYKIRVADDVDEWTVRLTLDLALYTSIDFSPRLEPALTRRCLLPAGQQTALHSLVCI